MQMETPSFKTYKIGLVPGPTHVLPEIAEFYTIDYASPDLEDDFFQLYQQTQKKLAKLLNCDENVVIMSGEAMVVLWGSMKSVLKQKQKVLAISTGVFGYGFGKMAEDLGAEVKIIEYGYNQIVEDFETIEKIATEFQPHLITLVHCETPSGTLNPLKPIGDIAKKVNALFYVDFVASAFGVDVNVKV